MDSKCYPIRMGTSGNFSALHGDDHSAPVLGISFEKESQCAAPAAQPEPVATVVQHRQRLLSLAYHTRRASAYTPCRFSAKRLRRQRHNP
jgi:hypothetical protein